MYASVNGMCNIRCNSFFALSLFMQLKFFFAIPLSLVLLACNSTMKTKPIDNEVVQESSPQRFILSDGLQISLTPPAGFSLTTEHFGFTQAETFSRIKVYEVEIPYKEYLPSLSAEKLALYKMQLVKQEDITIANAICHISEVKQAIAGTVFDKKFLVCGDELSSVVVESSYPESAPKKQKEAIEDTITSLSVKADNNLRVFTGLPFYLKQTPGYKITKRFRNSIVLEPLANQSNYENNESTIVISHGVSENTSSEQLSAHFLSKVTNEGLIEISNRKSIKIGGIPALESTAYIQENDKKYWFKQVVSYQENRFLLIQGRAREGEAGEFERVFEELLSNFEFR